MKTSRSTVGRRARQLRHRARQLCWRDWVLLAQAFALVVGVRLGLRCLSFRTLDRVLRRFATSRRARAEAPSLEHRSRAARAAPPAEVPYPERAAWAVRVVARRLLRKRPCLTQALVLRLLLQRRGLPAMLQIGVNRGEDGVFAAHAWLESDGRVLIGGEDARDTYPNPMVLDAEPVSPATPSSSEPSGC